MGASRFRRLRMGLETVLGLRRRGFFIPYRHADGLADPALPYPALERLFEEGRDRITGVLDLIETYADDLIAIDGTGGDRARWTQDWFPRLDAASAYAMVRHHAPGRIIEIGSGHSTRFMHRAVQDGGLATRITAIDPAPRADIAELPIRLERMTVQSVDLGLFDDLGSGDFVCVDSSHIMMPGSDVDIAVNRILPALPAGTFVFFHDILLPDGYPEDWTWRGYNEQNAVAALLQGGWEIVFASHYAATRMSDRVASGVAGRLPLVDGALETGLWLRRKQT